MLSRTAEVWSPLIIGSGVNAVGVWNQNGGLTVADSSTYVGDNYGTGTLNLNGGVFATNAILGGIRYAYGTGTIVFNGGTLRAIGDNPAFFNDNTGNLTVTVESAGGTIDTDGFNVVFNKPILEGTTTGGGLTKTGLGNLTLVDGNTYSGDTNINAGQLTLASAEPVYGCNDEHD